MSNKTPAKKNIKAVSFKKEDKINENIIDEENNKIIKKGGAIKDVDEADDVDDDDYSTDNGENDDKDEEKEDDKDINSDDDLENKNEEEDEEEDNDEEDEEEGDDKEDEEVGEVGEGDDGDVECVYRFTGKKKIKDTLELKTEDNFFEEDAKKVSKFVDKDKRITKNLMTIYERVRLLGERAKQLSLGAKPMIKNIENKGPKEIAKLELEQKVIPLIIIRTLPNGLKEKWFVNELMLVN